MNYTDVKRIRQNPSAEDVDCTQLSQLIDEAIEKQIAKRVTFRVDTFTCPSCGDEILFALQEYCDNCGQKLGWSGEE